MTLSKAALEAPAQGRSEPFNLAVFLLEKGADNRPAVITLQGEHTYGQLRAATLGVAHHLSRQGVERGDRVVLMAENSFFWVASYLGILRAGLVAVPLSSDLSDPELDDILRTIEPRCAFVQATRLSRFAGRVNVSEIVTDRAVGNGAARDFSTVLAAQADGTPEPDTSAQDLAALMYTSGSTGTPRGVMVSHGNIRANTESIIEYLGLVETDRVLSVLPFHYCFGTSLLHTHLRVGGAVVVDTRFLYPEKVLDRMAESKCTGFAGVPSHFQILLTKTSFRRRQFPHLRWLQQAGGHLPPTLVQKLQQSVPHAKVFVMYGQTEATARLSYLPPEFLSAKSGSIGRGIPGVHLSVEKPDGTPVCAGEVGEIVAKGENVTLGYWRAPEDTASTFRNGRLHTGDLATVDEDGFISVVGRLRDFLKCGGKRISCKQLEEQLLGCQEVTEVAVLGVPDGILGEAVVVFAVPRISDGNVAPAFLEFCRRNLPFQLLPRQVIVLDSLPKNSAGKVLKEQLRNQMLTPSAADGKGKSGSPADSRRAHEGL